MKRNPNRKDAEQPREAKILLGTGKTKAKGSRNRDCGRLRREGETILSVQRVTARQGSNSQAYNQTVDSEGEGVCGSESEDWRYPLASKRAGGIKRRTVT